MATRELYFDNPRLQMGAGRRFVVRLVVYSWYGILTAMAVVLVFAELRWMQSLGVFLFLFLFDRMLHLHRADEPLWHLPKEGRINLSPYVTAAAMNIFERGAERAVFVGGDFYLWILKYCLAQHDVRKYLTKKGQNWRTAEKNCNHLVKAMEKKRVAKREVREVVEKLVVEAGEAAIKEKAVYIEPAHLFLALKEISSEKTKKFFGEE